MELEFFSTDFGKNPQISNFMKALPVAAKWFCADRRTEWHDKADGSFSQFKIL